MSMVVEIGHPDADISRQGDRVKSAIEAAGLRVLKPFMPDTGLVVLDAADSDAELVQDTIEDALGREFPAFVEMNRFYVKVVR